MEKNEGMFGHLSKKNAKNKGFTRYWFELRGSKLYYFKSKESKKAIGRFPIKKSTEINKEENFGFSLKNKSSVLHVKTTSRMQRSMWIRALQSINNPILNHSNCSVNSKDFSLIRVIGKGNFSTILKVVEKKSTPKEFAMKIIDKSAVDQLGYEDLIMSERDILVKVNNPFIVKLQYAFQTKRKLFFVMNFLPGGELFFHLSKQRNFSLELTRFYAAEIVLALEYLHKNNIVYRDLKPENIVLEETGHIVLADLGLSYYCGEKMRPVTTFAGTPEYIAPEILLGREGTKAIDWYGLGIIIYEMLVGLPPFYHENVNEMYSLILSGKINFPNTFPDVAKDLVRKLLEKDPKKRLGSGKDGSMEIRNNKFFKGMNWFQLKKKEVKPPFVPDVGKDGLKLFDDRFMKEKPLVVVEEKDSDQECIHFFGFDFERKSQSKTRKYSKKLSDVVVISK